MSTDLHSYPPPSGAPRTKRRYQLLVVAAAGILGLGLGLGGGFQVGKHWDEGAQTPGASTEGVVAAARAAVPSVVSVKASGGGGDETGSGVVLEADGYILTNAHVVTGSDVVTVILASGREVPAQIVGTDESSDVAVLKVEAQGLRPIQAGSSRGLEVGTPVVAVGAPLGLSGTVTSGIVSSLDRSVVVPGGASLSGAIQTDAAINPGNSGGALVDENGRLVGINTAIATTEDGSLSGSIGLGFAIPVEVAQVTAEDIIHAGTSDPAPNLGVTLQTVTPDIAAATGDQAGVRVTAVTAGGPAAKAGVEVGDTLLTIDGQKVQRTVDLVTRLRNVGVGNTVELTVSRNGREEALRVSVQGGGEG